MTSNQALFERAQRVIPGGVNSPVRAFRAVGGTPRFIARAQGPYMWDAEGTRYTDYIGSWGPMILGHGHPEVLAALLLAALDGFSFGAPTEREVELAEAIIRHVPGIEQVRLLAGLSISADKDCREVGDIARGHLGEVQAKLAELQQLEHSLQRFVAQCDAVCCGGPGRDCVVFQDLGCEPPR